MEKTPRLTKAARVQRQQHPDLPGECFRCRCGRYYSVFDRHFPYHHTGNRCRRCDQNSQ